MVKKVTLEIPDEVHEQLSSLCAFYKQDVKQIIFRILKAIGSEHRDLTYLSEQSGLSTDIERTLRETVWTSIHSTSLFNYMLEKLGVKGEFWLDDFDFDLEENYFMFHYCARSDNLYNIYSFDVTKEPGRVSLSTNTGFYINEVGQEALNKLKQVAENHDFETPKGFDYVDEIDVEIEEGEEMWTLRINCWTEALGELPTIKQVSQLVKRICKKAGIEQKK